jgi:(p)ppGpp synthase/HD superfamily hydrolase
MKQIALNIIETAFAGKLDKGGEPYIGHLKRVSENAKKYFSHDTPVDLEKLEVCGLLHDLIEDCPEWSLNHLYCIFKSEQISFIINLLTHQKDISYEDYIRKLKDNPFARAIKLADLEDNMNLLRLKKITDKDLERVKKYHQYYIYLKNN